MKVLRNKRKMAKPTFETLDEFLDTWTNDDLVKISTIDTVETSDFIVVEYVKCQTLNEVAIIKVTLINGCPVEVELLCSTRVRYEY